MHEPSVYSRHNNRCYCHCYGFTSTFGLEQTGAVPQALSSECVLPLGLFGLSGSSG